jgi:hypothetical protein
MGTPLGDRIDQLQKRNDKMAEALCKCLEVFQHMAERGAYPGELLQGDSEYMGIPGTQFIKKAIMEEDHVS